MTQQTSSSSTVTPPPSAPASSGFLEAINLTKRYEDNALAVDDVSFTVPTGEIYAMLGGNGAGNGSSSLVAERERLTKDQANKLAMENALTRNQLARVSR